MGYKILLADDEAEIRDVLRIYLEKDGYVVTEAADGVEAMNLLRKEPFDLVILDIMMPGVDGYRVLRSIRETNNVPVIMLSAKGTESDKILGLDLGADDYITKPFSISEVIARVRAVLRRTMVQKQQLATEFAKAAALNPMAQYIPTPITKPIIAPDLEPLIKVNGLTLDPNTKGCQVDGRAMRLTRTEYGLLLFFMTHRHRVYTRDEIIRHVWDDDVVISERTIDTNITRLRKRLGPYGKYICTRSGFGYVFEEGSR